MDLASALFLGAPSIWHNRHFSTNPISCSLGHHKKEDFFLFFEALPKIMATKKSIIIDLIDGWMDE